MNNYDKTIHISTYMGGGGINYQTVKYGPFTDVQNGFVFGINEIKRHLGDKKHTFHISQ
jgi:hypothetical protein